MRIWIDGSLVKTHYGGVGRYLKVLAEGLRSRDHEVVIVSRRGDPAGGVSLRVPPRLAHLVWSFSSHPRVTSLVPSDLPELIHSPVWVSNPPPPKGIPLVMTVHDTWCLMNPQACSPAHRFLVGRAWHNRSRWHMTIAVSEATRSALIEAGLPEERIRVVRWGVSNAFRSVPETPNEIRPDLGLSTPNLVFVGPINRKKGADVLLAAFELVKSRGLHAQLVLRGPQDLRALPKELQSRLGDYVRIVPPLVEEDLARLYRQAAAVICPSRAEGFNLPLAEAVSVGATVIASDIPVHREVAGAAAMFVPPGDIEALASAIERALGNGGPGPRQAFTRSLSDMVQETEHVYREVLSG